jgi:hypothetical protein
VEKHVAKADRKNTATALNLEDPAELVRRPLRSFLGLETELANLGRTGHRTVEEAAVAEARIVTTEARIKAICKLANRPGFSERFIRLLRNRWRSSAAMVEYVQERNQLLLWIREAFPAAEERRRRRTASTANRDRQMAEEFQKRKNSPSRRKDSALKEDIGKDRRFKLKRSASIEAIDRGLKALMP